MAGSCGKEECRLPGALASHIAILSLAGLGSFNRKSGQLQVLRQGHMPPNKHLHKTGVSQSPFHWEGTIDEDRCFESLWNVLDT